jgi:hypothetical protein
MLSTTQDHAASTLHSVDRMSHPQNLWEDFMRSQDISRKLLKKVVPTGIHILGVGPLLGADKTPLLRADAPDRYP